MHHRDGRRERVTIATGEEVENELEKLKKKTYSRKM